MDEQEIKFLLEKYRNGTCSSREKTILESWYNNESEERTSNITNEGLVLNLDKISSRLPLKYPDRHKILWSRIAAAASIVVGMAAGFTYYTYRQSEQGVKVTAKQDIGPGGNKAYLTLADGRKISLKETALNYLMALTYGSTHNLPYVIRHLLMHWMNAELNSRARVILRWLKINRILLS